MYRLLIPIIFTTSVLAAGPVPLPSNFKKCARSDADFNGCLVSAVQSALRDLEKGSKPVGVLPLDPLKLKTLGIHQGSGPVAIDLDYNNPSIDGVSKIVIESSDTQLDGDIKTLSFSIKADYPLTLTGDYTIKGKVLILPIAGTGKSTVQLHNTRARITFTGKIVNKGGVDYLVLTTVKLDMNPSKVKYNFENLFNGDKALGENMNLFLNMNDAEVYGELKAEIEKAFATTFIAIANNIFTKVPYDSIFPK